MNKDSKFCLHLLFLIIYTSFDEFYTIKLKQDEHILFFYKSGQGKIFNKQGNDAMEWVKEVDPFHLDTLTIFRKHQ
ncbi:hypothetical protein BCV71DRAFT_189266 [Rhizopus microsporus]|uniref:Uncharacterized protein n=1 Tax=Rhizopus microsporus TaxID=58291 RepID=A0A1X0RN74_RHIZD|nr:hypothetical protein BCV71DRAFT_189266 [Rhizopus microsporus]